MSGGPEREVHIDATLVRGLLQEQHADLASLPITELAEGWDNVTYRLGDALTVRLPRRALSAPLLLNEQRWLPQLARDLPLPVPAPIRSGAPSSTLGYPWHWSIGPWLTGAPFEREPPTDRVELARCLGGFLVALHRPAPADAPSNPYRGVVLGARNERFMAALDQLGDAVDRSTILARWRNLVATPLWQGPPLWLHGDLHPLNLLVEHGRLSAVIDFGDLCAGDPATDLSTAWMLFAPAERQLFRAVVQPDPATWRRAQGWALALSLEFAASPEAAIGRRTMSAVLDDEP